MAADVIHLLGDTIRVLAGTNDSNGELTVIEVTSPAGGGPPLHTHPETEVFLALEGEIEVEVDGAVRTLRAGEAATAPSEVPHTYRNASDAEARFVVSMAPAGMERFFAELAAATAEGPPDMAQVTEIAGSYGMRFVGAPAPA